ncbi:MULTISPECIES: phosphoglycerate dehydrogenase [unclassified Rhodococcus (in: high G+C Gram-positive bacteria)]|uniref:phosphoglycerate dehydrogenase n=1 Tax=unclassified Rhodococcus (in: high G+C Gram-positive bacteria) TaxID=192944 RepID=UPI000B9A7E85|nr:MULTISPECIES: phosphoglycerate dehydrogenase [unclassified Rhodococcus (in: high G+C Gram-positive bacteria)]OZE34113.1 hydroxyacid dehydrogenase [Rhodococcus sp. 05-2254-4]OZE51311.1 hydroxyacid dehydrogenase [Rhodococcus sp. 05-2254-3]OZE52962.1 hydroxyacid dehydrogenase [Rhodococcus sp. 05-2254-2]
MAHNIGNADAPSHTPGTVLVTTPTFGRYSSEPRTVLEAAGHTVTQPGGHAGPPSREDIEAHVQNAAGMIVGLDRVDAELMDSAPALRVVAKHGVGYDNIDVDAAKERGIAVVYAPGSNSRAVAELTFGLILDVTRGITASDREIRAGRWTKVFGSELAGRTLGVIGYGRIGRMVAAYGAAFGMQVITHDPMIDPATFTEAGVTAVDMDTCISSSDVVTLHIPAIAGVGPILDRARLQAMRSGAVVINAARGGLVDEQALADLLVDGHLAGAGLDAFAIEPLGDSPLRTAPGVVLTSHIGACSREANRTMGTTVALDIARVLAGNTPVHSAH